MLQDSEEVVNSIRFNNELVYWTLDITAVLAGFLYEWPLKLSSLLVEYVGKHIAYPAPLGVPTYDTGVWSLWTSTYTDDVHPNVATGRQVAARWEFARLPTAMAVAPFNLYPSDLETKDQMEVGSEAQATTQTNTSDLCTQAGPTADHEDTPRPMKRARVTPNSVLVYAYRHGVTDAKKHIVPRSVQEAQQYGYGQGLAKGVETTCTAATERERNYHVHTQYPLLYEEGYIAGKAACKKELMDSMPHMVHRDT
jgi:hypothetical protein